MKRAVAVLPLAVAALALTGCGNWEDYEYTPRAGTVTELEEEAGYFEEDCYNQQVYDSRTGTYKTKRVCNDRWVPGCYEVDFTTPEGQELEECADEDVFDDLEVGDVYIEGMDEAATHTPWITPSPSPSTTAPVSPSPTPSASSSAA